LAIIAYALATAAVWIIYDYAQQYLSLSPINVGILMLIGMIGAIVVVVGPPSGYKSGALNHALARTSPEAQAIVVFDSDYVIDARWLRNLVPQFTQAEIAVVQAPQDYRNVAENAFKTMPSIEYRLNNPMCYV